MDGSPLFNLTAWAVLYRDEYFDEEFCARAIGIMSGRSTRLRSRDPLLTKFPELRYLLGLRLNRLRMPDAAILLDLPPRVAIERIGARGEARQVHETEEKLAMLASAYRMVCRVIADQYGVATVVLDGTRALEDLVEQATAFAAPYPERGAS